MKELTEIVAIVMSLTIPIVAIIVGAWVVYNKKKNETKIKQSIILNNLDAEAAKMLLADMEKPEKNKYKTLQSACMLIGLGVGYGASLLLDVQVEKNHFGFWILMAVGIGMGLLVSFFLTRKLSNTDKKTEE